MSQCNMHTNMCTFSDRDEAHHHKPYEPCTSTCPYPHYSRDKAEDWFERWVNAKDEAERAKVEKELLPPKD